MSKSVLPNTLNSQVSFIYGIMISLENNWPWLTESINVSFKEIFSNYSFLLFPSSFSTFPGFHVIMAMSNLLIAIRRKEN